MSTVSSTDAKSANTSPVSSSSAASSSVAASTGGGGGQTPTGNVSGCRKAVHLVSVSQLAKPHVERVIDLALTLRQQVESGKCVELCKGRVLTNLFFEPSTRTSTSFHVAMLRLGGQATTLSDTKALSVAKGESLADTVRCLQSYSDVIVIRHPEVGAAMEAAKVVDASGGRTVVVNGGDGAGEHPTQALIDLFTICVELGRHNMSPHHPITVTFVGDLKYGRTVHSLVKLLLTFNPKVHLCFASPKSLGLPEDLVRAVTERGVGQTVAASLEEVLPRTDVLYMTRLQKERFRSEQEFEDAAAEAKQRFTLTPELLKSAKRTMCILHPLPRGPELSPLIDSDPRAAYFRQMKDGLFVRMALLALLLGDDKKMATGTTRSGVADKDDDPMWICRAFSDCRHKHQMALIRQRGALAKQEEAKRRCEDTMAAILADMHVRNDDSVVMCYDHPEHLANHQKALDDRRDTLRIFQAAVAETQSAVTDEIRLLRTYLGLLDSKQAWLTTLATNAAGLAAELPRVQSTFNSFRNSIEGPNARDVPFP